MLQERSTYKILHFQGTNTFSAGLIILCYFCIQQIQIAFTSSNKTTYYYISKSNGLYHVKKHIKLS